MTYSQGAESPSEQDKDRVRPLKPESEAAAPPAPRSGGSGADHGDAGKIVDALKASADQEFNIAERLSAKARQSFALAAGVFVICQTVAFNSFEAQKLSGHEKYWMIGLAIGAVSALAVAVVFTLKTDATYASRDLPLQKLEDDLNAAYEGDPDVIGNLGTYYLGIVRSRRQANDSRRTFYFLTIGAVLVSLGLSVAELLFSLVSRTS